MKMRWILVALLLLLAVPIAWIFSRAEWTYKDVPLGPQGPARDNPLYATHRLATELGAKVVTLTEGLTQLPPVGGTLYLSSNEWSIFPGRVEQLQHWIDQGGHLVVSSRLITQSGLSGWLPVSLGEEEDHDEQNDDDEGTAITQDDVKTAHNDDPRTAPQGACSPAREGTKVTPRYPGKSRYTVCVNARDSLATDSPILWSLTQGEELVAVRVSMGAGSVTVHSLEGLFSNRKLQWGDHALLATTLLQAAPGRDIWFLHEENREAFARWLWRHAKVAVILGLLAIGAGLWRGAIRFGPGMPVAVPMRRSMREQLTGTAQFLRRHDPGALHRAALRALDEAAQIHLQRYASLTVTERAQALAARTQLPADALAQALRPSPPPARSQLGATLQLLETARRRLRHSLDPSSRPNPERHPHADPT